MKMLNKNRLINIILVLRQSDRKTINGQYFRYSSQISDDFNEIKVKFYFNLNHYILDMNRQ